MIIPNSNIFPDYLKLKYDIPNNIPLTFSFYSHRLYNGKFDILLSVDDIPYEWLDAVDRIKSTAFPNLYTNDRKHIILKLPTFGEVHFYDYVD